MMAVFISLLAGVGLGLLTWYGWALAENVRALRVGRQNTSDTPNEDGQ